MGSLTVHIVDKRHKPISGKKVFCNFPVIPPTHHEEYTNNGGLAEFRNVPACTVEVYVDGHKLKVGVGRNDCEDVTISI